jgi:Na+/proline symporter
LNLFTGVSVAFLLIYLVVGVYVARNVKTLNDFYVMGRNAPPLLITGTLIATNASSVTFIGFTGTAFSVGPLFVAIYGMTMVASLFVGLYLGRYLWRLKLWTIPDYFARRFPSEGVRAVATAIVLISMVLYLISIMLGTMVALDQLLGWSNILSLIVILGIITVFTFIGGMQGVVITDTIMFLVFFAAGLAMAPFIISAAGGWPDALSRAAEELPRFTRWNGANPPFEAFWLLLETNVLSLILVVASPQLISRAYIARDEKTLARAMIYLALVLPIFVVGTIYVFGMVPLITPKEVEPAGAFPWVATNLVPPIIGALALAGVVAAAISTASSLFQQGAAALSRDIYQRFINPDVSDSRFMLISRASVVVIAVVVFLGSISPQLSAAAIVYAFLLASAAWAVWLPALVAGIVWSRATTAGAFWSMLIGLVITLAVGFGRQFEYVAGWVAPNVIGLVVSTIILVIVSLATRPSEQGLEIFREMRQPVAEE